MFNNKSNIGICRFNIGLKINITVKNPHKWPTMSYFCPANYFCRCHVWKINRKLNFAYRRKMVTLNFSFQHKLTCMKSLLLIEDHEIMARTLVSLIHKKSKIISVTAMAKSAEDALSILSTTQVDVILVDISLPQMSGVEFVKQISKLYPDLPCLVISGHNSIKHLQQTLAVGAWGYVTKDDANSIIEGIETVLKGERYIGKRFKSFL